MQRASSPRSRWWLAIVQVILLLVTTVAPAAAATTPSAMTGTQLIQLLQSYGIVKGDDQGNLNLDKPITRAEMITILVRAVGGESEADLYKSFNMYSDAKGHWAEGYLNYATVKRLIQGDGNGTVRPQDPVSYAEVLTMLVRLVGKEPTTGEWPNNVFFVAIDLKLVPDGVTLGTIRQPAVRGLVFQSLGKSITEVTLPSGKTALATYLDTTPPQVQVTEPGSTNNSTVRVTGTHRDAVTILVNNKEATINGSSWSAEVDLQFGENTVLVVATDAAGNQTTATIKATRNTPISRLEITGPSNVRKGGTATFEVKAFDNTGKAMSLTGVSSRVEGNIGTFNLQTGVFAASNTEGSGRIVVTSGNVSATAQVAVSGVNQAARNLRIRTVNDGRSVSITQDMTVVVEVLDASMNMLADDNGRSVSLQATGISGLTVTPSTTETVNGLATFKVRSTSNGTGTVNLMATSSGLSTGMGSSAFGTNVRVQLTAEPSALNIGTSSVVSRIKATLLNEQGQAIANNTGNDIRITVTQTGTDGVMSDQEITIYRGLTNSTASGDDAFYNAGTSAGTARISGVVSTGQGMSVDTTAVTVTAPQVGSAAKWDLVYPPANLTPGSPTPAYFSIRMADASGGTVPANFAFQLEISTSNNETKTAGIPAGVVLSLAGNAVNPVYDGIAEGGLNDGSDVIVRTVGGLATFAVQYDKVGQVYVKVIGMPGATQAYGSDGSIGAAVSASHIPSQSFTLNFTTTPTHVKLVADSALGKDQPVAAVTNTGAQSIKVRAYFTDAAGNWIPGSNGTVTLARNADGDGNNTIEPAIKTISVVDGKAEFTVTSTGLAGTDTYTVTAKNQAGQALASPTSNPVSLVVQNSNPGAPSVLGAHGMRNGVPGGGWYMVAPDDTHLQLEVAPTTYTGWATINLYAVNQSTPFYTSDPVELNGASVRILVPKSKLPTTKQQYLVSFKNAIGETNPRVATPDQVTNATYSTGIALSYAKYDRVGNKLYIYGSGFGSTNTTYPDTLNTHFLTITDSSLSRAVPGAGVVNLGPASLVSIYNNVITLDVSALSNPLAQLSGVDVTLSATSGWYVRYTGEMAQAASGATVGPMAKVDYVTYDKTNRRLLLTGAGFNTGAINQSSLKLVKGATQLPLTSASSYRVSDNEWSLSIANLPNVLAALEADLDYTLEGIDGWFYDTQLTNIRQNAFTGVPVYDRVMVSSVSYDRTNGILIINGAGFTNGNVNPAKLSIVNTAADPDTVRPITGTLLTGKDGNNQERFTDTKIMIQLDAANNPLAGDDRLTGSSLYVIGSEGWITKTANSVTRTGAPIPLYMLLLPTQN